MLSRLLKVPVNIALLIFPTCLTVLIFDRVWYPTLNMYIFFGVLVVVGYGLTVILIIVACNLKLCNLWLLALGFLPTWVPIYIQGTHSQEFMHYFGTLLVLLFYTIPAFTASLSLAIIRARNEKLNCAVPENDPRRD